MISEFQKVVWAGILSINIVLQVDSFNNNADINDDGTVDILDIVLIVNIILGN